MVLRVPSLVAFVCFCFVFIFVFQPVVFACLLVLIGCCWITRLLWTKRKRWRTCKDRIGFCLSVCLSHVNGNWISFDDSYWQAFYFREEGQWAKCRTVCGPDHSSMSVYMSVCLSVNLPLSVLLVFMLSKWKQNINDGASWLVLFLSCLKGSQGARGPQGPVGSVGSPGFSGSPGMPGQDGSNGAPVRADENLINLKEMLSFFSWVCREVWLFASNLF